MESTFSLSSTHGQDSVLKGAHRSRLSFHFHALRRRCWLMVQWVSIPAETQEAEGDTYGVKPPQFQNAQPSGFAGLLDNFQVMQTIRQRI